MKTISIIIPLYHGKYFVNSITRNVEEFKEIVKKYGYKVELICVNDKPKDILKFKLQESIKFKLINNKTNIGIQRSRIKGLKEAQGDYIIFLDQDDKIIARNYLSQLNKIKYADVVVGNLYIDVNNKKKKLYKTKKSLEYAIKEKTLLSYENTIISPGQCLIRKKAIPKQWCHNILKINGADDFLLWLLLYNNKARFVINDNLVYYHRTTKLGNLSSDKVNMYNSDRELVQVLRKIGYPEKKYNFLNQLLILIIILIVII